MSEPQQMFRKLTGNIIITRLTLIVDSTDWRLKYNAAEVYIDWIYNTIGRYRVVPLLQFMVDQTDAVPFLRHQGYPEDMIFDPPTQQ